MGIICIVMLSTDHKLQVPQKQSRDMAIAQNRLYTKWKNTALQEMEETAGKWLFSWWQTKLWKDWGINVRCERFE